MTAMNYFQANASTMVETSRSDGGSWERVNSVLVCSRPPLGTDTVRRQHAHGKRGVLMGSSSQTTGSKLAKHASWSWLQNRLAQHMAVIEQSPASPSKELHRLIAEDLADLEKQFEHMITPKSLARSVCADEAGNR
jgi:hypothetical protein